MLKNKKFFIKLLLVILWIGVIFYFSNANSTQTTKHSLGITKSVVIYSIKVTNYVHITNIEINDENINKIVDDIHPFIRKAAHFFEYFVLAILVLSMIKETKLNYYYSFTILFCIFMAIFDESHQLFVAGRSGNFKDIFIDIIGSILYLIINKSYHVIRKNKCQ